VKYLLWLLPLVLLACEPAPLALDAGVADATELPLVGENCREVHTEWRLHHLLHGTNVIDEGQTLRVCADSGRIAVCDGNNWYLSKDQDTYACLTCTYCTGKRIDPPVPHGVQQDANLYHYLDRIEVARCVPVENFEACSEDYEEDLFPDRSFCSNAHLTEEHGGPAVLHSECPPAEEED